jgi:plastocyanin
MTPSPPTPAGFSVASRARRAAALAVLPLLLAGGLTGCGGSGGTAAPESPTAPAGANQASTPQASTPLAAATVAVTEQEFTIQLSASRVAPGATTFDVRNAGAATHDLHVQGPGVQDQATPPIQPGGSASLTVTLQPGTYTLWCGIDGHRAAGMQTGLTVA